MTDKRKVARDIVTFGYLYNIFDEKKDNYKTMIDSIEKNLDNVAFVEEIAAKVLEKIYINTKYIRRNVKLTKLLDEIDDIKIMLVRDER